MNDPEPGLNLKLKSTNNNLSLPYASQQDIIRSSQRDQHAIHRIAKQLNEILSSWWTSRTYLKYKDCIIPASSIVYLSLTTGRGLRTLGEEYCGILPIYLPDKLPMATKTRRFILICLLTLNAKLLNRITKSFLNAIRSKSNLILNQIDDKQKTRNEIRNFNNEDPIILFNCEQQNNKVNNDKPRFYIRFLRYVLIKIIQGSYKLENIVNKSFKVFEFPLIPLHRALFYLIGTFHDISRHITSQRYIFMRSLREGEITITYRFLGLLGLIQVFIQSWTNFKSIHDDKENYDIEDIDDNNKVDEIIKSNDIDKKLKYINRDIIKFQNKKFLEKTYYDKELINDKYYEKNGDLNSDTNNNFDNNSDDGSDDDTIYVHFPKEDCMLCMSPMKCVTSTPCGHIFCWNCVMEWVTKNEDCPLCRQSLECKDLIRVIGI